MEASFMQAILCISEKKKKKKKKGRIFVEVDLIVVTLFDKFVVPLLL
jgi:hypothetical protein